MPVTNLPVIQKEMIRYGMTIYLALGLVGNICNCIMFTRHPYRHSASSIYFLSFSIFAIIYLFWAVVPFIHTLNYPDLQTQSVLFCKVRLYGIHVLGQYLRYLVVFSCVDRFIVTRIDVRIRSLTSVSMAKKLVIILCVIWLLFPIHMPILMNIRGGVCGMFGLYKLIYAIYQILVAGILPPVLMSILSILTIRSLHQRHGALGRHRQIDRYLMRMVTAQVIVNIITSIPYSVNLLYGAITYYVVDKSAQRLEIEAFITFATQFLVFLISVASFYLFLLTSKRFRTDFFRVLVKGWNKYMLRRVQIIPLNEHNNAAKIIVGRSRTNPLKCKSFQLRLKLPS
jgi:hypothetical protein